MLKKGQQMKIKVTQSSRFINPVMKTETITVTKRISKLEILSTAELREAGEEGYREQLHSIGAETIIQYRVNKLRYIIEVILVKNILSKTIYINCSYI